MFVAKKSVNFQPLLAMVLFGPMIKALGRDRPAERGAGGHFAPGPQGQRGLTI